MMVPAQVPIRGLQLWVHALVLNLKMAKANGLYNS
jgi:hypothetical protein